MLCTVSVWGSFLFWKSIEVPKERYIFTKHQKK